MIAYFLPLYAGAEKVWGSPTDDFWCCHGSLVQAHTMYADNIWFEHAGGVTMSQYIPSELAWAQDGVPVTLRLEPDAQLKSHHRPDSLAYTVRVQAAQPVEFSLRLRVPWWVSAAAQVTVNGEPHAAAEPSSYVEMRRTWRDDTVHIMLPKALVAVPLPDEPHTFGFMDGPVVLAGLNAAAPSDRPQRPAHSEKTYPNYRISGIALTGDPAEPGTFLIPDDEREWTYWRGDYRTRGQAKDIRLIPLHEVRDEVYTVYFSVS